jgi:hypothetical protein
LHIKTIAEKKTVKNTKLEEIWLPVREKHSQSYGRDYCHQPEYFPGYRKIVIKDT